MASSMASALGLPATHLFQQQPCYMNALHGKGCKMACCRDLDVALCVHRQAKISSLVNVPVQSVPEDLLADKKGQQHANGSAYCSNKEPPPKA